MELNFQHIQAAHCENGVTTNLLKHAGMHQITEPLAFGIGAGIFYIHIPFLKISGGPAISFRTMPGQRHVMLTPEPATSDASADENDLT